jgi:tetratricopeptide (TPR) repeat protein
MRKRTPGRSSDPLDPVLEILRGGDPAEVAQRSGISVEELLERRNAFLKIQLQKAHQEDVTFRKVGRNDPCPCSSGHKYKKCCMQRHQEAITRMDPEEVGKRRQHEHEKDRRDEHVQEGYSLLTRGEYDKAKGFAHQWLERYPEDDRFHDILATAALYLGQLNEAIRISESRWRAAEKEKAFFLANGRHTYDDPGGPPGHAYAPQAWLEKYWVALRAEEYTDDYPEDPDQRILARVKELQKADDLERFPQSREEGLQVRKEALAETIQALKDVGPQARSYLMPLCTRYSWTALLIPEILLQWADDASMRALVEIALFHYPFLSESCLKALEQIGERSVPHLIAAFERDREFDPLKIGLISVAGRIRTPETLEWITSLLDHSDATIVNWAGGILGKADYVPALEKLKKANGRIGGEPMIQEAIDRLSKLVQGPDSP